MAFLLSQAATIAGARNQLRVKTMLQRQSSSDVYQEHQKAVTTVLFKDRIRTLV